GQQSLSETAITSSRGRSDVTQDKRPVTLITGASAGIGAALAREFAANGHELLLVARREPALVALADAIAEKGAARPTILSADVARTGAAQEVAEALELHGLEPADVVNNAGAGLTGAADKLDRALSSSRSSTSTCARSPICRSPSSTASNAAGAAFSTSRRWRRSCRVPDGRSITPARLTCFRSARRCIASSSRTACA